MLNVEIPLEKIAERIDKEGSETWYLSLYMTYAYGQVPLHPETVEQCNF